MNVDAKKKFAITMTGENLSTLTQVTDNAEPCLDPFGGDNGAPLYFSVRENKKYYNIYKKANPFSAAMSQKTSGKNFNRNPWYNPATDKLAFSCMQDGSSTSDIFTMFDNKGKALLFRTVAMTPETIRSGDSSMNKDAASADGRLKKWLSGFVKK